jgi:hypothetical protein
MGFVAGLGVPTGMGVPTYFISDEVDDNQWDQHTYLQLVFDRSGSMNAIIPPIISVCNKAYCGSGSAGGGDCVKASNSLRATLQDFYATGATEESGNADAATNGSTAYDAHVAWRVSQDERYLTWFHNYTSYRDPGSYNAGAGFATYAHWEDFAATTTINHIVCVSLCNESRPSNDIPSHLYHRHHFGDPHAEDVTCTVDGATTTNADFVSDTAYDTAAGECYELTHFSASSGGNSIPMYLQARSSGGSITAGTKINNINVAGDGKTVTLSNADHSFVDGETLTFRVTNPGWDNTDVMVHWSRDVSDLRQSLATGAVDYSSATHQGINVSGIHGSNSVLAPENGMSGIGNTGQYPSIHWIHVDAGSVSDPGANVTGLSAPCPVGPQQDPANYDPGGGLPLQNASQRILSEGAKQGLGDFANYSLSDYNELLNAWNGKNNTFVPVILHNQSGNTSESYWYAQLISAISLGMTI